MKETLANKQDWDPMLTAFVSEDRCLDFSFSIANQLAVDEVLANPG